MTKTTRVLALVPLALGLLAVPPSVAQEETPSPSLNLGEVHFENSGPPEAQVPFLQGLAALHSFFYDEAADLFRDAQKAAPDFAMAYWGEAMTYNHPLWRQQDREAALEVLDRLAPTAEERAAKAGSDRERAYLEAVEILYGEGPKADRDMAYSEAMKRLAAHWPRDIDAAAFYALSLQGLQREGDLGLSDRMRSAAVLERLFDHVKSHPGVLHYLIHAFDDPIHAPLGLRAAVLYARVAPAAPHALHMPSHIFVQLGMWDRVVASNIAAYQASVDWVKRRGHSRAKEDFHSLSWLQYGYLQEGQFDAADRQLATIEEVAKETGDVWVERYRNWMAARRVLESRAWEAEDWKPLTVPEGADASGPLGPSLAAMVFVNGLAEVERGELDAARQAHARLVERLEGLEDPGEASQVLEKELVAKIRLAEGHTDEGLAQLGEAVALEEEMGLPSGPVHPIQPAHEMYGEVLLDLGRSEEAAAQFERALQRTPNRAWSLLGSARAAVALGDTATARERYGLLAGIWHQADPKLEPLVAEARKYVEGGDAVGP
jgi:tetratricopeptide (TPR) repeat protein